MATKKTPKPKKPGRNWLLDIVRGKLLSIDYYAKHWAYVLLCVAMILVYITNRYQCLTRMEQIHALRLELEAVQTESIRERSRYMSRIRESSMQQLVDSMHLNLHVQEKPPYRLPAH